jgi:hypothetical protein
MVLSDPTILEVSDGPITNNFLNLPCSVSAGSVLASDPHAPDVQAPTEHDRAQAQSPKEEVEASTEGASTDAPVTESEQPRWKVSLRLSKTKIRDAYHNFLTSKNGEASNDGVISTATASGCSPQTNGAPTLPTTPASAGGSTNTAPQNTTPHAPGSRSTRFVGRVSEFQGTISFRQDGASESWPTSSAKASLDPRREMERRNRDAQATIPWLKKVSWADHGKEHFGISIAKLTAMNQQLERLLPSLKYENPLQVLRGAAGPSTIWVDTEIVREGLEGLHTVLSNSNPIDDQTRLKFAIQLENSHEDARRWMEVNVLLNGLNKRSNPVFFSLMGEFEAEGSTNSQAEYIVAGTVSKVRKGLEITNVPRGIKALQREPADQLARSRRYQEIGDLSLDSRRIYSLRRIVEAEEFDRSRKSLTSVIDSQEFTPKQHTYLAAKIALAHIHFASARSWTSPLQPSDFYFFRQSYENAAEWAQNFTRTPWVAHGIDVPIAPPTGGWIARTAADDDKIYPTDELGLLLYQITSATRLNNVGSQAELAAACVEARKSLDKVQELCGLRVREIVQVCLSPQPQREYGERDPALGLIEEIADALQRCENQLKRRVATRGS